MINYNSALKVVNLGEPEASLILRKPRSPQGQGAADPIEPDRLDPRRRPAVGKHRAPGLSSDPRLDSRSLDRLPRRRPAPRRSRPTATHRVTSRPRPATATSRTIWHTEFVGATPGYPHELVVDLGARATSRDCSTSPARTSPNGRVKDFEVRVSDDGKTWSSAGRVGAVGQRPVVQVCRPCRRTRPLRPASRLERGRGPAVHERRRAVDRRRVPGCTRARRPPKRQSSHEPTRPASAEMSERPLGPSRPARAIDTGVATWETQWKPTRTAGEVQRVPGGLDELDRILRGELTRVSSLRRGGIEVSPGRLSVIIVVLGDGLRDLHGDVRPFPA